VLTSDLYAERHAVAAGFGLHHPLDAGSDVIAECKAVTEGRGADVALLAVGANSLITTAMNAVRPGGKSPVCLRRRSNGEGSIRSSGGVYG